LNDFIRQRPFLRFCAAFLSRYFSDHIARAGAELAYFLLFSLFPLLLLAGGLLSRPELDLSALLRRLPPLIPADVLGVITDYLTWQADSGNAASLLTAAVLTLYSMTRVMGTLLHTLSRIYRVPTPRRRFHQLALSASLSLLMLLSVPLMLSLIIFGDAPLNRLFALMHREAWFLPLWDLLRFTLLAIWALFVLTLLYLAAPNRRIRLRAALPGAVFAMFGWVAVSMAFSYYVNNMARWSMLYGSLGAVIVLMLWLYLTGIIILLGGLFNHLLEVFKHGEYTHEKK